jgi:predicted N-acetyltransferase YhbS
MDIALRLEEEADFFEVEKLIRAAFWDRTNLPGVCVEHFLAHILRQSPAFVPALDYVALRDGIIVGNIMYSESRIVSLDNTAFPTLTFGPVSVLPAYQRQGIGSLLVRATLEKAKECGYGAVIIMGHPSYYPRFGFENAAKYGITTVDGANFDAFMALELVPGALSGISGVFHEASVFQNATEAAVREFDKRFLQD